MIAPQIFTSSITKFPPVDKIVHHSAGGRPSRNLIKSCVSWQFVTTNERQESHQQMKMFENGKLEKIVPKILAFIH